MKLEQRCKVRRQMEIKDLVGLSEPLTKLIDVVSKGCGKVAAPYLIRAKAKAEADRIRIVSEALREAAVKNNLPIVYKDCLLYTSPSPRDRTRSRMPSSA